MSMPGRWVVVMFLGSLAALAASGELTELLSLVPFFEEARAVFYGILSEPPADLSTFLSFDNPAMNFVTDYDAGIAALYDVVGSSRTLVLDPMLRAVANIGWDPGSHHMGTLRQLLKELPPVDASAGVTLAAPVLMVPRVFDFPLCDLLVQLFDKMGGSDSGFLLDQDGKTGTVIDHRLKRRTDLPIVVPQLCDTMRDQVVRRLLPAIERHFQFKATRMDRYLVSCYDSAVGGHFFRHRDNLNAGARHRRFAVSINLNSGYEGCDLVFPEFGTRSYRAPEGGAIVFACGTLHEVTPITRGRRYAFVPFLYGEEDAAIRAANNANLDAGEAQYVAGRDALFPAAE